MKIEEKLVRKLEALGYHISFGESMTGGMLASTIINVSGSSNVIEKSFVTYSNVAKHDILNVDLDTIKKYDVVSKEVVEEMVNGLYNISHSDICVSVSGYAEGYMENKGKVCFAIKFENIVHTYEKIIEGSRNIVRRKACNMILNEIYKLI